MSELSCSKENCSGAWALIIVVLVSWGFLSVLTVALAFLDFFLWALCVLLCISVVPSSSAIVRKRVSS